MKQKKKNEGINEGVKWHGKRAAATSIRLKYYILNKQPQKNNENPTAEAEIATATAATTKNAFTIEFGIRSSKTPQYPIYKCRRIRNNSDPMCMFYM